MRKPLYHINWTLQLIVGTGLFAVSFVIEYAVLQSFFATSTLLAFALAAFLELGKGLAIIWHRFLSLEEDAAYPVVIRRTSQLFRTGLLILSVMCSLTYLGVRLDRPALETVRNHDLQKLEETTRKSRERLQTLVGDMLKTQQQEQESELQRLLGEHHNQIARLTRQLDSEMNNVVKGEFIGKRYRAIEARLKAARKEASRLSEQLSARHAREREAIQEKASKTLTDGEQQISTQYKQKFDEILHDNYANDDRAQHPMIASLVNTFREVLGWSPSPLQLVFFFSIFLSSLMELGILQAFETVTLAIFPLLQVQHQSELDKAVLETEIQSEQEQMAMKNTAEAEQIKRSYDHVINTARRSATHAATHY